MSLKIKNLTFSFDKACLFNNLDFEVEKNEIGHVTGQSGVGKSTLLNIISGLIKPDSGSIKNNEVLFNDTKLFLKPEKRNIGYVFQDFALFPHINAKKNIKYAAHKDFEGLHNDVVESLSLIDHLNKMPHELSGGQKQRVSIARALLMRPSLILLDEPFSNLDENNSINAQKLITRMIEELQIPCLMVTHDINKLDYLKIEKNITLT